MIIIVAVLVGVALLAVVYYFGERRGRMRGADDKAIRMADRAFLAGLFGDIERAIKAEGAARAKAEDARLYGRDTRASS